MFENPFRKKEKEEPPKDFRREVSEEVARIKREYREIAGRDIRLEDLPTVRSHAERTVRARWESEGLNPETGKKLTDQEIEEINRRTEARISRAAQGSDRRGHHPKFDDAIPVGDTKRATAEIALALEKEREETAQSKNPNRDAKEFLRSLGR